MSLYDCMAGTSQHLKQKQRGVYHKIPMIQMFEKTFSKYDHHICHVNNHHIVDSAKVDSSNKIQHYKVRLSFRERNERGSNI